MATRSVDAPNFGDASFLERSAHCDVHQHFEYEHGRPCPLIARRTFCCECCNASQPDIVLVPDHETLEDEEDEDESGGVSLLGNEESEAPDPLPHTNYANYTPSDSFRPQGIVQTRLDPAGGGVPLPSSAYHPLTYHTDLDEVHDSHGHGTLRQIPPHMMPSTLRSPPWSGASLTHAPSLHAIIPETVLQDSGIITAAGLHQPATLVGIGAIETGALEESVPRPNGLRSQQQGSEDATLSDVSPISHVGGHFTMPLQRSHLTRSVSNDDARPQQHTDVDIINPMEDGAPDVMTFLDRWFLHAGISEAGMVVIDDDRIRNWRPLEDDFLDLSSSPDRDVQHLHWQSLDTDRRSARIARRMFYPSQKPCDGKADISHSHQRQYYDFKRIYNNHRARFTHYQLRHVLAATSRNDVFYAASNRVIRTSLSCPSVADTVIDLGYSASSHNRATTGCYITTIAVSPAPIFAGYSSDSILITGGFEGEYSLLNLNASCGNPAVEGFVTNAMDGITTHIHTLPTRRTAALAAVFCSNDRKIRVLDVGSNRWLSTFEYPDQPNCAATSPDGRLRVVVGDTRETLITDAEKGSVLFSMQGHEDDAFACAWADDGWHVATGAQDGKVVVYDAWRWDLPIATLECEMGCARSLQFTKAGAGTGAPALVVAEADDIVTIYDTRSWVSRQTIDFFGSVAGVAALDGGRELVVANGDKTVGGLMLFERNEDAIVQMDDGDGDGARSRSRTWNGKTRSRRRETDSTETFWENQPKRLGLDLAQLLI